MASRRPWVSPWEAPEWLQGGPGPLEFWAFEENERQLQSQLGLLKSQPGLFTIGQFLFLFVNLGATKGYATRLGLSDYFFLRRCLVSESTRVIDFWLLDPDYQTISIPFSCGSWRHRYINLSIWDLDPCLSPDYVELRLFRLLDYFLSEVFVPPKTPVNKTWTISI